MNKYIHAYIPYIIAHIYPQMRGWSAKVVDVGGVVGEECEVGWGWVAKGGRWRGLVAMWPVGWCNDSAMRGQPIPGVLVARVIGCLVTVWEKR